MKQLVFGGGLALMALVAAATPAQATSITIDSCYTGSCATLTGSVTVTITSDTGNENAGSGDVKVVVKNLTNGFIDQLGLDYTGGLPSGTALETASGPGSPAFTLAVCSTDNSGEPSNSCFNFPNPPSTRLAPGLVETFFLEKSGSTIDPTAFASYAFAHVNAIGGGEGSAKITEDTVTTTSVVPEPASLTLFGSGLLAAARLVRRRRSLDS